MNKQLRELERSSGLEIYGLGKDREKWEACLTKFAELFVQECVGVVEGIEPGYKDYRDQIEDAFRRDCVAEIKQHFGVEE
jgi:hypothetical protein